MKLQKRGFTTWTAIEIVVGVAFALILLQFAHEKGTGVAFEKTYLTKDIALTINALYGMPGDAVIDYDNRYMKQFNNRYDLRVGNSIVTVQKHSEPLDDAYSGPFPKSSVFGLETTYPYGAVAAHPISEYFEAPDYLAFILKNGVVDISESKAEVDIAACPQVDTKADIKKMIIVFDPGQSEKDKGNSEGDLEEYKLTKQIADSIAVLCKAKAYSCRFIQQQEMAKRITEIKDAKKDMLISIHIGNSDSNPAMISYPAAHLRSSKLACFIKSNLDGFDPVEIKQIDITKLTENDHIKVLEPAQPNPAVQIEIGSVKKTDFWKDPNNAAKIAESIIKATEAYYQ